MLHSLAAVLLFYAVWRLLAYSAWPAGTEYRVLALGAGAAVLFYAAHPLRVESVAWVTERRDVLSGLFGAAALLAYLSSVRPGAARIQRRGLYALSFAFFLLALLSKATVVPLPVVFLLLDWYPLRRWGAGGARVGRLVWEKLPFFLASLIFGALAIYGQHVGGIMAGVEYPLSRRIASMLFGIGFYLTKTIVPLWLSPLYEQPLRLEAWHYAYIVLGGLLLVVLTVVSWRFRHRYPALLVAWGAFLAFFLPVSGLLQTGPQIAADRYTYLCSVPIFVALARGLALATGRIGFEPLALLTGAGYLGLAILTHDQTMVWNNDVALWTHAVRVQPRASLAYANLAAQMYGQDRLVDAENLARRALAIRPDNAAAHNVLGNVLSELGRYDEAETHYQRALEQRPDSPVYLFNYATVLRATGKRDRAIELLRRALAVRPDYIPALNGLAILYRESGRTAEAERLYRRILEISPCEARALYNLGNLVYDEGRRAEAMELYQKALECEPTLAEAAINLATEYEKDGRWRDAFDVLHATFEHNPSHYRLRYRLGLLLAAAPEPAIRDVRAAENHARWMLERSRGQDPAAFYLLGVVYAARGDFAEAVGAVRRGLELVQRSEHPSVMAELNQALQLFERGQPLILQAGPGEEE